MSRGIAFFDFDGTITDKDSLAEFIRFMHGTRGMISGLIPVIPHIIGFKLGLFDRQKSKEKLLSVFFGGISENEFRARAESFVKEKIPGILRPGAVTKLKWHVEQGHEVVIVSASPSHWVKPWCEAHGFASISTELDIRDNLITGKIRGLNCHGEEKVRRIRENYNLSSFNKIYAYGDTGGDRPMLALASEAFYKPFRG